MTTKITGKNTDAVRATKLIAGTKLHFATAVVLAFASGQFTPAQIEASLQQLVSLRNDVENARQALAAKLAAEEDQIAALRGFMLAFVQFVRATFSKSPDILADFGIPKKVKAPLTTEQQAAAIAKRNATRAARGTKGSKQKAAIKGAVTGVTITPVGSAQPAAPVETSGTTAPASPATGAPAVPAPRA